MNKDLMDKLEGAGYSGEVLDLRGVIDLCGERFQGIIKMSDGWIASDGIETYDGASPEEGAVNLYVATRNTKSQEKI